MPYISKWDRGSAAEYPQTSGDLNFAIHHIVREYLERRGINYGTLNDVIGALECAKMEIYRRLIGPYEDEKIRMNGDIELYELTK